MGSSRFFESDLVDAPVQVLDVLRQAGARAMPHQRLSGQSWTKQGLSAQWVRPLGATAAGRPLLIFRHLRSVALPIARSLRQSRRV